MTATAPASAPSWQPDVDSSGPESPPTDDRSATPRYSFAGGGEFVLDSPADPEPLWGAGGDVLFAEGESLLIAGGQGAGKTTLAQQLALGRAGLSQYGELLGWPITRGTGRVLYLAMDRPRQAARSMQRMVGEIDRDVLDERLRVWRGPPPFDLAAHPSVLRTMCADADADTCVVDSLKDGFIGLTDDEAAAGWNRARQGAIEAGVQLVELHHQRKTLAGAKASTPTIDDIYGSTWITAGTGSVLLLTGAPGDPIVSLHHVKQPADPAGPLKVCHDHRTGRSSVWHTADLVQTARASTTGVTAVDAARVLFDKDKPTPAERQKARRRLEKLTESGHLRVLDEGSRSASQATRWGVAS